MTLEPGRKLAHYEIVEPIGKGGMGEVYRAKDAKLGRDVAIKVLPDEFAKSEERLARFEREAKVLASLNHPNIAAIYGLERSGATHYLVLELVEGETLAERIARGPIPAGEALAIAVAIADALEEAHEHGIVHRDLKPANVKITPDDKIKVLDFGLAKAFIEEAPDTDSSTSPTITREATQAGVILGTAAYMSPEQAKGKRVDKRTDIFALGGVMYEMLTGMKAFPGADVSEVLAAVLKLEPDWDALPANISPRLSELLRRCLDKDPRRRRRDVGDVRNELQNVIAGEDDMERHGSSSVDRRRTVLVGAAGLMVGVIVTSLVAANLESPPAPDTITRASIASETLSYTGRHAVALSRDGTRLVYSANDQLYLHDMDQFETTPIRGTDSGARNPFFSPDGQWIGFYARGVLRKVSVDGGTPMTLCNAGNPFGASWSADGTIVFSQGAGGIQRVSGNGGTAEVIVAVDPSKREVAQGPQVLPGGTHILFTLRAGGGWDEALIVVRSLETGEERVLIEGGADARYVPTGHLVYAREGTLFAVPFDAGRLEVTGGAVPVVEGVMGSSAGTGAAQFTVSETGTLVFAPDAARSGRLISVDRKGRVAPLPAPARPYEGPRLSPDGTRLAFLDHGDIWLYDIPRNATTRLTFTGDTNHHGWTSGGERVFFSSTRSGVEQLYWMPADGTGVAEPLTEGFDLAQHAESSSLDGRWLAFGVEVENGRDIWVVRLPTPPSPGGISEADREPRPLLDGRFNEEWVEFSPDGRWLGYSSDETGRDEIYVQPFPGPGAKVRVSSEGGDAPMWARSGRELFYRSGTTMMVVPITTEGVLEAGRPERLFDLEALSRRGPGVTYYDVTPDGERFIMVMRDPSGSNELRVVINWFEELKDIAPAP